MRFSDTTQFQVPQPIKYANSDSSPFNSDESLSEEDSQTIVTPSSFSTSNQNTPSITSNDKSLTPSTNDNSLYRHIINTLTLMYLVTDQDTHLITKQLHFLL